MSDVAVKKEDSLPSLRLENREKIFSMQDALFDLIGTGTVDEVEMPLVHYFAPDLYARECYIEKGAAVVGKIHRHAHVNTISKGRVRVFTEYQEGFEEWAAPMTFVSEAGTKRAVYALEDTIWTTYHPTTERDLDKIEAQVIAESYDDLKESELAEQNKLIEVRI